jgi:hypothetical protein
MSSRAGAVRIVAVLAALAVVIGAIFGLVHLFAGPDYATVTPRTLSKSVTRATGGGSALGLRPEPCRHRRATWSCFVANSGSPGGAQYRVSMRDPHCWNALKTRRVAEDKPLPIHSSGCVVSDDARD